MSVVAVVGPGRMGVGISAAMALTGEHEVRLVDLKHRSSPGEAADDTRRRVRREFDVWKQAGLLDRATAQVAHRRCTYVAASDADTALRGTDVVFEALPEITEVKASVLRWVDRTEPKAVIGSTTSTLLVDTLAQACSRPERFMVTHWLNPAVVIPLVEISPGSRTAPEAVATMEAVLRAAGKSPVRCAASPGYISTRISALVLNEAVRLLKEGVASAEDIDTACRLGLGIRMAAMGPLEFLEHGGVQTLHRVSNYLQETVSAERYEPAPTNGLRGLPRDATTVEHARRLVRAVQALADDGRFQEGHDYEESPGTVHH